MAQSRPPPVRVHTTTSSPPPLSPRTHHGEKKHHSRRKSGKTEYVSERKSSRPATLTRKSTPQYVTKAPSSGRSHGHGHREREEEERGRDSGESFPQFCMSCEKQFLPANNTFLYCSEACRIHDLQPSQPIRANSYSSEASSYSPPVTPYTRTFEDGPDIIPRFSPTQSRPRSYFASEPYPSSYQAQDTHALSSSTPYHSSRSTHGSEKPTTTRTNSTALESLRELATALPPTSSSRRRDEDSSHSPPKSGASSSITRNGSSTSVWGYIPFTSSSKNSTPAVTPGNSYTPASQYPSYTQSQSYSVQQTTYGNGYGYTAGERSREDVSVYGYAKSHGMNTTNTSGFHGGTGGMGMDRPLPPRSGPGGYGHRPKSVDLVTPFGGH